MWLVLNDERRQLASFVETAIRQQSAARVGLGQCVAQDFLRWAAMLFVLEREMHGGFDQADMRTAIETATLETEGIDLLFLQQLGNRVGQLDLAARACTGSLEKFEDLRIQHIPTDYGQITRRHFRLGLLDDRIDAALAAIDASVETMP